MRTLIASAAAVIGALLFWAALDSVRHWVREIEMEISN